MKQFVIGAPLVSFINCQTKEEIKMPFVQDYLKINDEIILDYANICIEEYKNILSWISNENFVKIKLSFCTTILEDDELFGGKKSVYEEFYPVIMVYKPFVKNSNYNNSGTFEIKIKVRE